MTKAQQYFKKQMQNKDFANAYNNISEQVNIEWELEMLKNHIKNNIEKDVIINELEKIQAYIHSLILSDHSITKRLRGQKTPP